MVITHLIGGLGNQMFQYAAGRALSLELKTELMLDISDFNGYRLHHGFELHRLFDCSAVIAQKRDLKKVLGLQYFPVIRKVIGNSRLPLFHYNKLVVEPHFQYWPGINDSQENCYILGYWQSAKYFENHASRIKRDFTFKLPMSEGNSELASRLATLNAVSIHVRRGDYVENAKTSAIHGACSPSFYEMAINFISQRVPQPCFFIFSDDIEWARNNIKTDFQHEYVSHNCGAESFNDMRLMSMCKHHIIANSSFSWWAAWLGTSEKKIVVAPSNWFARKSINTSDLIPPDWTQL
jgi:Glycosyl transferase family 11